MTDYSMIEAGPECDKLVAEACGTPEWHMFCPSVYWADAMFAAEKFGLFKDQVHAQMLYQSTVWGELAWCVEDLGDEDGYTGLAPTGPLAICRAILKKYHDH